MDSSTTGSKIRRNIISRVKGEKHVGNTSAYESDDVTDEDNDGSSHDKKVHLKSFWCIRSACSPFGADSDLLVVSYVGKVPYFIL